ncbi:MAG: hypothetical protein HY709_02150, partial [Candidatus Latescibacteria bacterium]|nr:hypothetical protein [Candidatus Latescibacterota bacterium]
MMKNQFDTLWESSGWRRVWVMALVVSLFLHIGEYYLVAWITAVEQGKITLPIQFVEPEPPPIAVFQIAPPPLQRVMALRKEVVPSGIRLVRRQAQTEGPRFQV